MSGPYAYSLDRETFLGQFETRADALKAALAAARQQPEPPTEVYVALKTAGDPQITGHAEHVIARMTDRAEAAAEAGSRYLRDVSEHEEADLDIMLASAINAWLQKHNRMPEFFTIEAISEHPVRNPPETHRKSDDKEVTEIGNPELP